MNSLDEILNRHFFPDRKKQLKEILDEFSFDRILLGAYNRLSDFKSDKKGIQLIESPAFGATIAATLYDINQELTPITDDVKKALVKKSVSELIIRLIFELIRELEVELMEMAPVFDRIVQAACAIYGYDYNDFQEHINLKGLVEFSQDLSGYVEANQQRPTKKNTIAWQLNELAKYELIDLIRNKRVWARKPNHLLKLFDNPDDNLEIFWSADHLEELAHLIYKLHKEDIIGCNGNRGTFSAVEKHLHDFEGNKIKKGRLKTLSHRINESWKRYEQRLIPVIEIIQAVLEKSRN